MPLHVKQFSLSIIALMMLTGCLGKGVAPIQEATLKGDYTAAAIAADDEKDLDSELDESNQLPTLYAGNSYLYANDYKKSLKRFDEAEKIIKYHDNEILLGSSGDLVAQLLMNDAVIDYHSTMTDGIMVNTYKAIDYMSLGKMGDARIEFNRAIDRQRRAKDTYSKMIKKYRSAIKKKEQEEQAKIARQKEAARRNPNIKAPEVSINVNKNINNPQVDRMIASKYPSLSGYKVYPDFINPFTNYLAGIFFATQGDYTKSADILKEVYGMSPNSSAIKKDLAMVENILDRKKSKVNNVWVIYANGLSPKREQFKVNIPLIIFTNKVPYTGIALPKMVPQRLATKNLSVFENGKLVSTTKSFASMDRVILTEFKYSYKYIVARAVFGALIKTYLQYEAGRQFGDGGAIAMGLLQFVLTQADTRVWGNLPKEYQVARLAMPKSQKLQLHVGAQNVNIELGKAKNAIVFVRMPTATSKVSYNVIKL